MQTFVLAIVLFPFLSSLPAQAGVIETQKLYFGKWVITDNQSVHSITVETDGSYNNSPELIMIEEPQQGIYQMTELPDGVTVNDVTVSMQEPLQGMGGEDFTMDNFQVLYSPTVVDQEITVTLGARAQTSGDGNNYGDGIHTGQLLIEIHL
ncbi:MAG: hypothetical protein DI551_01935 [Micavibrio aeruginosavorus]|uniref:DUF4402 domain-containing protein n=1 Tax=Micavibrio aeruginosavorus TaxID=349221 RepID=A0A2W5N481_9BACT|nr:MAG: hypothetical protein DI551_01935 [Micavibrio aeruginosavorus]